MASSDFHLAQRAANGERDAFRQLLERHYAMLYRMAYRYFGDVANAEDVAQEVCLSLAAKIRSFEGRSKFSTWLYQVAINTCRDHARRQMSIKAFEGASATIAQQQATEWQETAGNVKWLYEAIDTLDATLKETVLLVLA